jgi:hypothetical protein
MWHWTGCLCVGWKAGTPATDIRWSSGSLSNHVVRVFESLNEVATAGVSGTILVSLLCEDS